MKKYIYAIITILVTCFSYCQVVIQDTLIFREDAIQDSDQFKIRKEYHVSESGETDGSVTGSICSSFKTLSEAKAQILAEGVGNTGLDLIIHPGTYNESITFDFLNFNIKSANGALRGSTYINGTLTISNNGSSFGISGINVNNLVHSGTGGLYVENCNITTLFTKSGTGYTEIKNTGMQSVANITGSGQTVINGTKVGTATTNNASQNITIRDCMSVGGQVVTAGTMLFNNNVVFPNTLGGYTVDGTANSILFLRNTQHADLNGTDGKIRALGPYSIGGSTFNRANSILTGTNLGYTFWYDKIGLLNVEQVSNNTMPLYLKADGTIVKQPTTVALSYTGNTLTSTVNGVASNSVTITGGSGSYSLIKHEIEHILDVSQYPPSQEDGKYYIFTNVDNLNTSYYTVNGTAAGENDIMVYNASSNHYTRHYPVSNITQSGEYLVYVAKDGVYYYDVLLAKWMRKNTNASKSFVASENIVKGSAIKIKTDGQVEQIKAGVNTALGNLGYSTDYADNVHNVIDGSRYLSFSRESGSYKMFINSVSSNMITAGSSITIMATGVVKAESHVLLGGNVIVNVILKNSGTNRIDIVPYIWNGTTYVAGTTQSFSTAVTNDFSSCLNANNTLEVQYSTGANQLKINALINGGGVITLGTQVTVANAPYIQYKLISGGIGGKSLFIFNDGSANKYIINDTSTALVRTETSAVSMTDVIGVDANGIKGTGSAGTVLAYYNTISGFYAKFFDLSLNTTTASVKSYNVPININLCFGSNTTSGGALAQLSISNELPSFIGWVKSSNGIVLAEPAVRVGTRFTVNWATGNSDITFVGGNYFISYSGNTLQTSSPTRPEMALANFSINAVVVPDGIAQNNSNMNENVEVALNGDISNVHTGLTVGANYYLNLGTLTETETSFRLGKAISSNEILLNFYDTNPITDAAISTNTTNITSQGNRITALENKKIAEKVGWRFPNLCIGWGMAMVYNDGERDNVVAGGSNSQTRVFGDQLNDGVISQHHIDFNGDATEEAMFTGFAEIKYSTKTGIARSNEGRLFMIGRDNSFGQWGDGTTTAQLGRANKWILQTQSEVYGTNLAVTSIGISDDWYSDDGARITIAVTVKNNSNNTYNAYMRGFSSENSGNNWCLISQNNGTTPTGVKENVTSWVKVFTNPTNVIFWDLGPYSSFIIVDDGVNKKLMASGLNVDGSLSTGTTTDNGHEAFQQCFYDNGTPINNAKWVSNLWTTSNTSTTYMLDTNDKPYSCGYQGYNNAGFNNTGDHARLKPIPIPNIANRTVKKLIPLRYSSVVLLDNDEVYFSGFSVNFVGTNGTSNFKNGVNTDIVQGSPVIINGSYNSPSLMMGGIDKVWSNAPRGQFHDDFLFLRKRASKEVYFTGYPVYNVSLKDNSNNVSVNYARLVNKPSAGEYIEDLVVNGGKTDAGSWDICTTIITNKNNVYRTGLENNLTGKTQGYGINLYNWKRILTDYEIK